MPRLIDNDRVRWRRATWAILLFSVAMLVWALMRIGGGLECVEHAPGTAAREACELRRDVYSGIGVFAIAVLWLVGMLVLGVIWLVTRPPKRRCPRCAGDVRVGLAACPHCGYEFGGGKADAPRA